nr:hypothetical protein [Tanacetum cinerariifolium]
MGKDPPTPLLVARGFLTTSSAVKHCKKSKIADFMDYHLPGDWEMARDAKLNTFKDVLVFRRMVEFLGAIHLNIKGNMWESEELIEKIIDWNRPPKGGDEAWHIRIELIDLDGESFSRTFQLIPTARKLSKKEKPSEIIDLDHFHDS